MQGELTGISSQHAGQEMDHHCHFKISPHVSSQLFLSPSFTKLSPFWLLLVPFLTPRPNLPKNSSVILYVIPQILSSIMTIQLYQSENQRWYNLTIKFTDPIQICLLSKQSFPVSSRMLSRNTCCIRLSGSTHIFQSRIIPQLFSAPHILDCLAICTFTFFLLVLYGICISSVYCYFFST